MSYKIEYLNKDIFDYEYFIKEDVCRLCWNIKAAKEINSKFPNRIKNGVKVEVLEKIQYCLDVCVDAESLPNKVCEKCYNNIEKFYIFKQFCKTSDERLKKILNSNVSSSLSNDTVDADVKTENFVKTEIADFETDSVFEFRVSEDCDSDDDKPLVVSAKKTVPKKRRRKPRKENYCQICWVEFKSLFEYTDHNEKYHGIQADGLYKCFGCDRTFRTKKTRIGHEIKFCKGLRKGYKCSECERYLPKRRMYETHARDHRLNIAVDLAEDIFKCRRCKMKFKSRETLLSHLNSHEQEKKHFVCEQCGRVFSRLDYLNKHSMIHKNLKNYACPYCDYRARQKSSLNVHILKHTGERPFSCDLCPQKCISKSNLLAHLRRHAGVKKYECSLCSKKFGYRASLDEHMAATHDKSLRYKCYFCNATYTRLGGVRRHVRTKHSKKILKNDEQLQKKDVPVTEQSTDIKTTNAFIKPNLIFIVKTNDAFVESNNAFVETNNTYVDSNNVFVESNNDIILLEENSPNVLSDKVENELLLKNVSNNFLKDDADTNLFLKGIDAANTYVIFDSQK